MIEKRRKSHPLFTRLCLVLGVLGLLLVAAACEADDDPDEEVAENDVADDEVAVDAEYNWTAQSYTIAGTEAHEFVEEWTDRVRTKSGGRIDIDVEPGGAIVGYDEMLEALADGALDFTLNASGFFIGQEPAFGAWFNMPILPLEDPELARYLARQWAYEYGGMELAQELYDDFDVQVIGAVFTQNEPIHSTVPLETLDDFEGLRVRAAPGMTSAMFEAVGAEPVSMPGGEIFTALDTGVVDAAEFVGFTENQGLGLDEVTDYIQFPAFHSQVPIVDATLRQETWNELPGDLQLILEDSIRWLDYKVDYQLSLRDQEIQNELEEAGQEIHALPPEDIERVREIALAEAEAYREESEMSARFVDSLTEYLEFMGFLEE